MSDQTNDDEKKAESNSSLVKEKELVSFYSLDATPLRSYTPITHLTAYTNHYSSAYYSKVTAPPPDLNV